MENQVPLLRIKSLLSGENPIKRTPKGVKYRVFHVKRNTFTDGGKRTFGGKGTVFFFSDFGNRACILKLKYTYDKSSNHFHQSERDLTWIHVKNDRLVFSKYENNQYRNISNSPYKIKLDIDGRHKKVKNGESEYKIAIEYKHETRFKKIIAQWARRNKISVSKKQTDMDFKRFLLTLSYPEIVYFFDVIDENVTIKKIPSFISSELRGIKGLNHAFDKLIGTHGKKIKSKIFENPLETFYKLGIARLFKNLVSVDDLLKILEQTYITQLTPYSKVNVYLRYFLRNYSRDTIVNWMLKEKVDYHLLIDVARGYCENNKNRRLPPIQLPETNTFDDIEDHINRETRRNNRTIRLGETFQEIDYTETNKKYNKFEFDVDSFTCCLPKSSKEMIDVSNILNNCLSSYVNIHGKEQIILFVKQQDVVKYAISIGSDNKLLQFYGKYNKIPTESDYKTVCEVLKAKYIDTYYFDSVFHRRTEQANAVNVL